jgi:hypothetical protein
MQQQAAYLFESNAKFKILAVKNNQIIHVSEGVLFVKKSLHTHS